jgi:hypothetical protein
MLGNWRDGIRYFADISPSTALYIIDSIRVDTMSAKWCNDNITLIIYLQNTLLGTLFIEKKECECFICPYPYTFIKSLTNFTAYNHGGINTLKIDSGLFFKF